MKSQKVTVFIPLANDAVLTADGSAYERMGANSLRRLDAAYYLARELEKVNLPYVWALGAGAAEAQRGGPTLASLMRAEITQQSGIGQTIICNDDQSSKVYSTQPEITWAIKATREQFPDTPVHFVVVTQRRHMWRVRIIKWLWHPGTSMSYVVSGQTKEIPWTHEFLGYGSLLAQRVGLGVVSRKIRTMFPPRIDAA